MIKSSMVAAIQAAGTLPILLLELFYAGEVNDSRIKIGVNSADTIQRRAESWRPSDDHTLLCASSDPVYSNLFPGRLRNYQRHGGKILRIWGSIRACCKRALNVADQFFGHTGGESSDVADIGNKGGATRKDTPQRA
jgi:hypothetical protein